MNLIMCCAVYKGDTVTERGLRTMSFEIPGAGKKPLSIPIKLLPSFAAGETTAPNAFEEGTNVLINGRLYPMEGIMYIVPTQPLIGVVLVYIRSICQVRLPCCCSLNRECAGACALDTRG